MENCISPYIHTHAHIIHIPISIILFQLPISLPAIIPPPEHRDRENKHIFNQNRCEQLTLAQIGWIRRMKIEEERERGAEIITISG